MMGETRETRPEGAGFVEKLEVGFRYLFAAAQYASAALMWSSVTVTVTGSEVIRFVSPVGASA